MFLVATLVFARFPLTVSPEMLWLTFCKICLSQLALRVFILQENAHTPVLITNPCWLSSVIPLAIQSAVFKP
ncbi:hypothetical protein B0H14DRAFT_2935767 [Mycena olivaceomarginata]|nr:hypothetical protein B0H14DRAFT_2935767 [Mycena olivaceomarginata]